MRRTAVVNPVPSDPIRSGSRLLRTLSRPKIEPGIYDVQDSTVVMRPWVDIGGSGEKVTKTTALAPGAATVPGAARPAVCWILRWRFQPGHGHLFPWSHNDVVPASRGAPRLAATASHGSFAPRRGSDQATSRGWGLLAWAALELHQNHRGLRQGLRRVCLGGEPEGIASLGLPFLRRVVWQAELRAHVFEKDTDTTRM